VKTAEVDEQKTKRKHEKVISQLYKVNTEQNIYNILLINMTQSCQIKQRYTFENDGNCIFPLHCCTLYFRKDCLHVHF
jgi:hypothetical protein